MKLWIFLFSFVLGASLYSFTSCSKSDSAPPPVTDREGNTYKTVRIGEQTWMAENLRTAFNALPAGIRYFEGSFSALRSFTSFWSSTEYDSAKGWYLSLYYNDASLLLNKISKRDGFSIRCIKD